MARITLDAETFKALASEARLRVLKALGERRKTLAELSRELALNKATVHEHLQLLTGSGLVRKRDDEGRKWIYYELTWTGSRILHPEATTTFNVLLGLSIAAAGGGFVMLGRALGWWLAGKGVSTTSGGESTPQVANAPANGTTSDSGAPKGFASPAPATPSATSGGHHFFADGGWFALALLATFLLFVVLALFLRRKHRPKPLDEASAEAAERTPVG